MTSQRAKISCAEFLPKTPPTETPGFLKYKNGKITKHPSAGFLKHACATDPFLRIKFTADPTFKLR